MPTNSIRDDGRATLLRAAAEGFRDAIRACDPSRLPEWFQDFPEGCCGDVTVMLGIYLRGEGFGTFRYRSGWRRGRSHAWLSQGPLVVDITADQFPDVTESVIVTAGSKWHEGFEPALDYEMRQDKDALSGELREAYNAILGAISP